MSVSAKSPLWHAFPALKSITDPQWERLMTRAKEMQIPANTVVFRAGEQCQNYFFILNGTIRVSKLAENGRDIILYRVNSGDTCILTTSCLLANDRYPAEGITETEVRVLVLPAPVFQDALALSSAFRVFVFASFGERITNLITLVEAVALRKADVRLAERLIELSDDAGVIAITHHELASELGTVREVVSRLLKEFESQGYLRLGRGRIEITNFKDLEKLLATAR